MFLVRLHVFQFTRYSRCRSRVSLLILSHRFPFVKNFFQVFSNFFLCDLLSLRSRGQLAYISRYVSLCQGLFYKFRNYFYGRSNRKQEPLSGLLLEISKVILHHQSDHNHRRFCDKQQQMYRRCPHHGRQRSYAPADSSAEQPLHGSWV